MIQKKYENIKNLCTPLSVYKDNLCKIHFHNFKGKCCEGRVLIALAIGVMFSVVHLSHISGMPGGNFITPSTNVHSGPRMN